MNLLYITYSKYNQSPLSFILFIYSYKLSFRLTFIRKYYLSVKVACEHIINSSLIAVSMLRSPSIQNLFLLFVLFLVKIRFTSLTSSQPPPPKTTNHPPRVEPPWTFFSPKTIYINHHPRTLWDVFQFYIHVHDTHINTRSQHQRVYSECGFRSGRWIRGSCWREEHARCGVHLRSVPVYSADLRGSQFG